MFHIVRLAIFFFCVMSDVAPALAIADAAAPSGTLYLKSSADAQPIEALRLATTFHAQVTGDIARVHVLQRFSNDGADWVEGLYVFPLSPAAAVDELSMEVGGRHVRGEIAEKAAAQATYTRARETGHQASIVAQERPNMFTTAVANIPPHASVTVEITYLETLPFRDARYTLNLPLAITPRYNPPASADGSADATHVGAAPTPERVTAPVQRADIRVDLAPGFSVGNLASLHHPIVTSAGTSPGSTHLEGLGLATDRDFELVWSPAAPAEVTTAGFSEQRGDETFSMIMLTPPDGQTEAAGQPKSTGVPRDVTFIIDTSGSMQGPSIEQAALALQMGVDRLDPKDRFNIVRFASDYSMLFEDSQPAAEAARSTAKRFIDGLRADGGTEMRAPLERVLSTRAAAGFLRQVIFITDGSVGNESELISLIHANIADSRLFTVGIGSAPNAYFLQQAAAAGRGSYTFIAEREQVGSRMQALFRKLERPAVNDLTLTAPGGETVDFAAPLPGDLYAGDPLILIARSVATPGEWLLSGHIQGRLWSRRIKPQPMSEASGIAKIWARERIEHLTRKRQYDGEQSGLREQITRLALEHHLVSEFTSLVAVDEDVARPPEASGHGEQVATSAPVGGYWATTGYAKTATAAELKLLLGWLLLLTGSAWFALARRT